MWPQFLSIYSTRGDVVGECRIDLIARSRCLCGGPPLLNSTNYLIHRPVPRWNGFLFFML